ncbi:MAG: hypothetical protein L6413_06950 [Coriobacteriia bacterium]|nr:hypothetical protein [Coriobacteriia bacterium]
MTSRAVYRLNSGLATSAYPEKQAAARSTRPAEPAEAANPPLALAITPTPIMDTSSPAQVYGPAPSRRNATEMIVVMIGLMLMRNAAVAALTPAWPFASAT